MGVFSDIVQLPAITGGGPTQDFIIPGFGKPAAVIFIVTAGTSSGVLADQAILSFGFTDGIGNRVCSFRSEDNVGTSNTASSMSRSSLIDIIDPTSNTFDGQANLDSLITDGVRISYGILPSGEYLVTCILLNGSHLSTHVSDYRPRLTADDVCIVSSLQGTITSIGSFGGGVTRITVSGTPFSPTDEGNLFIFDSTGKQFLIKTYVSSSEVDLQGNASAQSPTDTFTFDGPPFQTDILIAVSRRRAVGGSITNDAEFSLGFAKRSTPIVNISSNWYSCDNQSISDPRLYIAPSSLIHNVFGTSESVEITAFNSKGFDSTTRGGFNWGVSYLAIAFSGMVDFDTWIFDTPINTGLFVDNGPNFKPKFMMYGMNHAVSVGSAIDTEDAGPFGISVFTPSGAYSHAITDEDASGIMNTSSLTNNQPVLLPRDDQTDGFAAAYSSMEDTGPELNWSGVMPTPRKWIAFGFAESASINSSGDLFTKGLDTSQASSDLYIMGHESVTKSVDFYLSGQTTGSPNNSINLFINGEVAIPDVVCPPLDDTASIQIKPALIAIYQSRIDALINQLGKAVRLIFDPILTPCPNCLYDVLRKRSNGIYRTGGPRPFKRGRKCPYCKGRGLNETAVEKCIQCLLKWNPQDAENYGISISSTKGIVRMKTFLTSADDMMQAKTAIANYDIKSQMKLNVKLIRGPIPVGLREDRYCISFWELL